MLTKGLHISLLTIHLLFCLVFLFSGISSSLVKLVVAALIWLVIFYSLLKYNQVFILSILIIFLIILSVPLFFFFLMMYSFNGIPDSHPLVETTLISITGMSYYFFNPLLVLIIFIRQYMTNNSN